MDPRPRRLHRARTWVSLALACCVALALTPGSAQVKDPELRHARKHLRAVNERIDEKHERLAKLDRDLSRLATRISAIRARLEATGVEMANVRAHIEDSEKRYGGILAQMRERSAIAYMEGPGAPLEMVLGATSYDDFLDRLGILEALNVRDGRLADALAAVAQQLREDRAELAALQAERRGLLDELDMRERELQRMFGQQRRLLRFLNEKRTAVKDQIWRIRPLAACPVDGPHAVADDFGAARYDNHGRFDHHHQGNDIMSPMGTPIVAPFPGRAVSGHSRLGGLYVKVFGDHGYVYNAHLSRLGTLGTVRTGDVVGYVGVSGNAEGPHDHFEWHPANGRAVDPHEFLMMVC